ncbi:MAG: cytochrome c biogenesis protein ResB [Chthoniobacterales bacterium]
MNSEKPKIEQPYPLKNKAQTRRAIIAERQTKSLFWQVVHLLGSLQLALILLATIGIACAVATFTESHFDSKVAHAMIYKAPWFLAWLGLLCLNLFAVTMTRWPWEKKHLGFVITHYGIITLLIGAAIGSKLGFEGNVTLHVHGTQVQKITTSQSVLEIETPLNYHLYLLPFDATLARPSTNHPTRLPIPETKLQMIIDGWSDALEEQPKLVNSEGKEEHIAVLLRLSSQALHQEHLVALGLGENDTDHFDFFGLATIKLFSSDKPLEPPAKEITAPATPTTSVTSPSATSITNNVIMIPAATHKPWLELALDRTSDTVHFLLGRNDIVKKNGTLLPGNTMPLGWADWQLELLESGHHEQIVFSTLPRATTTSSPKNRSEGAPGFHAFLENQDGIKSRATWVASGQITPLVLNNVPIRVGYGLELHPIPFSIELLDFQIPRDEGTETPGDFQATVRFQDRKTGVSRDRLIRMNHPASFPGGFLANITGINYKFSQAEWNPQNPEETTLQVLYDPGWLFKWIGSLGICIGIGMMFYWKGKK